uniref:Galectin n=1 Tax=Graphocephala atropunctata TaxID=36148 RepID=A0A1B6MNG8_9HEMI
MPLPPRRYINPFSHQLTCALRPQSDLVVEGIVREKAKSFTVNLVIGRNECPNIAFHFNPRLDQCYVARNTLLGGQWGDEEGCGVFGFPFARGKRFLIEIYLTHSQFLVAVDGVHYCSYAYRTPIENITGIDVSGAVDLTSVYLRTSLVFPSALPPDFPPSPHFIPLNSEGTTEHELQVTPIYGIFQKKLTLNSEIEIIGRIKYLPTSFFVNLQEGKNIYPHPEIPLHISSRFSQTKNFVVLANAWHDKGWGKEEFPNKESPFIPGSEFTLRIVCESEQFIAEVNNQLLLEFNHRVPYTNIDTILIYGDVFVYNIRLNL